MDTQQLRSRDRLFRLAFVAGLSAVIAVLRLVDPSADLWLPFRTSCGAITGLPCLFCGTTRAMHHLLNGEIAHAIYFNWLAIPILVAAAALLLLYGYEAIRGWRMWQRRLAIRLTGPRFAALTCVIASLWVLQITLAVRLHKQELLNPSGALYALFVH